MDAKAKIIEATINLIKEKNGDIKLVTTREIVKNAGVSVALINYHCQSKKNLIDICVKQIVSNVIAQSKPNMEGLSPMEKLKRSVKIPVDFLMENPEIAKKINRNISTISKEILKHRKLKPRNTFNADSICIHLKECRRCTKKCKRYQEPSCSRRDRNIGACNCCPNISKCKLDKYFYYANKAKLEVVEELSTTQRQEGGFGSTGVK